MTTNGTEKRPLPNGWTWTTVKNVAEINYGKGLPKRDRNDEGNIPVYGSSGITGFHSESIVKGPCLIIGRKGAAGAVHLSMTDCWPIDTTYYANLKSSISLKYAFYVLKTLELESLDRSTAIPSLSRDDLYVQPLPLAPFPEQERIVAEIEKQFTRLDQAVASLRRLQSNLARYKASVLKAACEGRLVPQDPTDEPAGQLLERILSERRDQWQAANPGKKYQEPVGVEGETAVLPDLPEGWVWANLEQISKFVTDGDHNPPKRVPDGIPHLTARNVVDWKLSLDKCTFITLNDFERVKKRYDPTGGDVIITCVGTLGRTAIVPENFTFSADRNLAIVRLLEIGMTPEFLQLNLNTPASQKLMLKGSGSTAQPHLYLKNIRAFPVALASLAEQERIVAEVERRLSVVTAIEQTITANLSRAERLRQSILHRAFTGQLVPQEN